MSVAELLSEAGALQLRRHLPGANLAFATATLEDGSRRVYFSLSGGWKNRKVGIPTPPAEPHTRVTYIDARARMEGQPPSPRFTELPTLRRPDHLNIVEHHRHLDSERLIATVLNDDLLATHASVRSIDVFTL
ncbi:deaminase domain-containing protein, partial [Pantoea sp. SIMBA_072]